MTNPIAEIVNAQIKSTFLGREDHGIFTAILRLDYGSSQQVFGGYTLNPSSADKDIGNDSNVYAFGINFLMNILDTLEIEDWEHLPGTLIRVGKRTLDSAFDFGIGHYLKDNWFYPSDLAKEFFPEE